MGSSRALKTPQVHSLDQPNTTREFQHNIYYAFPVPSPRSNTETMKYQLSVQYARAVYVFQIIYEAAGCAAPADDKRSKV